MFFWNDPTEDPNDPRSDKERAMSSALTLDANNVPTGASTPLPPRTPYNLPAATPSPMPGQQAAWAMAPASSGVGNFARILDLPGIVASAINPPGQQSGVAATPATAKPTGLIPSATPNTAAGALAGALAAGQQNGPGYFDGGKALAGSLYNGMAPVGHVWTEADLEPTSVLGYTGSLRKAFSGGDTYGYTTPSPNLALFRADQARQAQGLNFAAEMANALGRQAFQASENEKDRNLKLNLNQATVEAKKDQDLAMVGDQRVPWDVREQKIRDMVAKGKLTSREAGQFKLSNLLDQATNVSKLDPRSLDFYKYLAPHFEGQDPFFELNKGDLISELQKRNVTGPDVARSFSPWGVPTVDWLFQSEKDTPDRVRAVNFARSLLSR